MVEHWVVVPAVVGSTPPLYPILEFLIIYVTSTNILLTAYLINSDMVTVATSLPLELVFILADSQIQPQFNAGLISAKGFPTFLDNPTILNFYKGLNLSPSNLSTCDLLLSHYFLSFSENLTSSTPSLNVLESNLELALGHNNDNVNLPSSEILTSHSSNANLTSHIRNFLQYTIPEGKLFYPEPFLASPSYMHTDLHFLHILQY